MPACTYCDVNVALFRAIPSADDLLAAAAPGDLARGQDGTGNPDYWVRIHPGQIVLLCGSCRVDYEREYPLANVLPLSAEPTTP
jgi:hypothetical protein